MAYTKTTWANGTAPAINAANLQNIEDALADLNALAADRTILDIDADTVSGYGIGVAASQTLATFAAAINGGKYKYAGSTTGAPSTQSGAVDVTNGTTNDRFSVFEDATGINWEGYRTHGNTGAITWVKNWNQNSDGNGGQPPAPKPKAYSAGATQGEVTVVNISDGATWTNPGGTWEYTMFTQVQASKEFLISARGIVTTGNVSGNGAGYTDYLSLWRIV